MVNYNESSIYKLCCRDPLIKDLYIGSTTCFVRRKNQHKTCCNNKNDKSYNQPVYKFIRDNGDWNNWDMVEVEKFEATDKRNLHARERYWIEELKAGLNYIIPTQTKKEYCEKNKVHIAENYKEYCEKNKKHISAVKKEYREKNKEQLKEYREKTKEHRAVVWKEYREKNKEQLKEYREKNKEKIASQQKAWYEKKKLEKNKLN